MSSSTGCVSRQPPHRALLLRDSHIKPCSCTKAFPSIHSCIFAPALFNADWSGLGSPLTVSRTGDKASPRTTCASGIKDARTVERKTRGSRLCTLIVVVVVTEQAVYSGSCRQLSWEHSSVCSFSATIALLFNDHPYLPVLYTYLLSTP